MTFHDNLQHCALCDQMEGGRCTAGTRNITDHARDGVCPLGLFGKPFPDERRRRNKGPLPLRYKAMIPHAIELLPKYPEGRFQGQGIVIAAGGIYFDSAYVTLRILRELEYPGPIELWHFPGEIARWMRDAIDGLDVTLVDAGEMLKRYPAVIQTRGKEAGYQLKAYALLNSRFEEALYLDADAYPIRHDFLDLFGSPQFQEHGAIFFPDSADQDLKPHQWACVGLSRRDEADFESGIIYLDKQRRWRELNLALWMVEHGPDHFFKTVLGDKSCWHLAWRLLGSDYAMPEKRWTWPDGTRPPESPSLQAAMIQHDFDDEALFVHRTVSKFSLTDSVEFNHFATTRQIPGKRDERLPMEDFAWKALEELREIRSKYLILHRLESNGDLLTLLPALKYLSRDREVTIITHRTYAPLVEGVPWLNVVPYDGSAQDVTGAILISRHLGELRDVEPSDLSKFKNWSLACWARTGIDLDLFHKLPLEIENRDRNAEAQLVARYRRCPDRPLLLVNFTGKSSPFDGGDAARGMLAERFGDHLEIVDLGIIRARRIIDLLGLYEVAVGLVSIDTGTLHLGYANLLPTVAIVNDKDAPGPAAGWRASERRSHWVETLTYGEAKTEEGLSRIGGAVEGLVHLPVTA